jgi:hypothetical protein
MKKKGTRKVRKNRRTQRRKTLAVKRGGGKGFLRSLFGFKPKPNPNQVDPMLEQPLLSAGDASAAPAAPASAAPAPAAPASAAPASASTHPVIGLTNPQKTLIITSLINLILNNISEEDKNRICHYPANKPAIKTANKTQKLKDIYEDLYIGVASGIKWTMKNAKVSYTLEPREEMFSNIWKSLPTKCGTTTKQYDTVLKCGEQVFLIDGPELFRYLFLIGKMDDEHTNKLLYTIVAVCIEYFRRRFAPKTGHPPFVYNFDDLVC